MADNDEEGWLEAYCRDRYSDQYAIQWMFPEGEGGTLGDGDRYTVADLKKAGESREHVLACLTAAKTANVKRDNRGFYWGTLKQAKAALVAIKQALKSDPGGEWPEWAVKAKAAGWKAPKGWKP